MWHTKVITFVQRRGLCYVSQPKTVGHCSSIYSLTGSSVGSECFQTNKQSWLQKLHFSLLWQWKTIFVYNRCFYQAFLQNYVFFNNSSLGTNIGNVICLRSTIQRRVRWGVINTISLVIRVKAGSQHFIQFYQPLLLDKRELLSWKL